MYKELVQSAEKNGQGDGIEMFHGKMDDPTKVIIQEGYMLKESRARCLVTTIAFGMGVELPDVSYDAHWGPPQSLFNYWQEVGRCARDGSTGHAGLCCPPHTVSSKMCDPDVLDMIKRGKTDCLRRATLYAPMLKGMTRAEIEQCCGSSACCSACDRSRAKCQISE